jgi:hypothetical protein
VIKRGVHRKEGVTKAAVDHVQAAHGETLLLLLLVVVVVVVVVVVIAVAQICCML